MPGENRDAERIRELEQRVQELEGVLEAMPGPDAMKWAIAQANGQSPQDLHADEMTTLERYAQMPLADRVDTLPASEMRATLIFDNWGEWARTGPYGDMALTTAQEKPATLRVLLREADPTVDVAAGEDLAWNQVYRSMRAVHRLTDGAFVYDDKHTSPDNTDSNTCHCLALERPGAMPTIRLE